ncbi:Uncharacterised protein [Vibrio cholerae]|nr:Uncharacterised protein [Vibrio cholerae]CSC40885.1 Uncharacterised protein [Vibrio cholerae]CSD05812.1 Uncharacterised protein [Vibrio cholerae]CSI28881.1 Uncharacterised protein [Vibrio cholerae]CSI58625.1 Uncharacterised protein [Vibrio cholerae]
MIFCSRVHAPFGQLSIFTIIKQCGLWADKLVPRTMQVVRHDVDVIQYILHREVLHTTQQVS